MKRFAAAICLLALWEGRSFATDAPAMSPDSHRPPTLTEIIEMRAIDGVTVSPDQHSFAFRVVQRSVAQDRVTEQWYIENVGSGEAVPVGRPHEPIWLAMYDLEAPGDARWLPDGRSLLVRESSSNGIQVHRLGPGGLDEAVTNDPADVETFALAADGRSLQIQVRNARADIDRAQAREEDRGVFFDRHVSAEGLRLTRNFAIGNRLTSLRFSDPSSGAEAFGGDLRTKSVALPALAPPPAIRAPRSVEENMPLLDLTVAANLGREIRSRHHNLSVRVLDRGMNGRIDSRIRIGIEVRVNGVLRQCPTRLCSGTNEELPALTILEATGEIIFVRVSDDRLKTVIYGWNPRTGAIRTILDPGGSLDAGWVYAHPCPKAGPYLICEQAGPVTPPRIVRVDLRTGEMIVRSDPNADLAGRDLGEARIFTWPDAQGRLASGVLILPRERSGPLPLVITTNNCRGFPRGGASFIAPEHVMIQRGFAALCVSANRDNQVTPETESGREVLGPYRAAAASYEAVVDILAREGIIDRSKVGLCGHSFSATAVTYAISHSNAFHAAVIGGAGSTNPLTYELTTITPDSYRAELWSVRNLPPVDNDPERIWQQVSPAANAAAIHAPLLMELPESEYFPELELLRAIERAGGVSEMYVFPGEGHWSGRRPVQQYWRSLRAIDWLDFWLTGHEQRTSSNAQELERWEAAASQSRAPTEN